MIVRTLRASVGINSPAQLSLSLPIALPSAQDLISARGHQALPQRHHSKAHLQLPTAFPGEAIGLSQTHHIPTSAFSPGLGLPPAARLLAVVMV